MKFTDLIMQAQNISAKESKDLHVSCNKLSACLLYTSPSPRDAHESRMPSSA